MPWPKSSAKSTAKSAAATKPTAQTRGPVAQGTLASKAADASGGNGFMEVSATHAALLLAQGAGRLIRTTTDRGIVAVLDPRLETARYGRFLKASLPPMWSTTDPALVRQALKRLGETAS